MLISYIISHTHLILSPLRIALWERRLIIMVPLGVLSLAQWTLLYFTMFIVHADWDDQAKVCVVTQANPSLLNVTFFFSKSLSFMTAQSKTNHQLSDGIRFRYPRCDFRRFNQETYCSYRPLEATLPRWSSLLLDLFLGKLYSSGGYF